MLYSVDLPSYYDSMLVIRHSLDPVCQMIKVINMHIRWDPHVFQGSYLISTLEHMRKPWGTLQATQNCGERYKHISSIQTIFHTNVYSLSIQNGILH